MADILIIDDSVVQRMLVKKLLQGIGHRVLEASSCKEARAHLEKEKPQLIIIDILMPEEDGLSFMEEFKKSGGGIPFIILSSDKQPKIIDKANELGVKEFIFKPLEEKSFLESVKGVLGDS